MLIASLLRKQALSMPPTNHQLSSRLQYNSQTPSFLRKLQSKVGGRTDSISDDEAPSVDNHEEFEQLDANRPAIPRRPPSKPSHEDSRGAKHGDEDSDEGEERPTVVVLREGKHLTAAEVVNEKRKAKGLPPLPTASQSSNPGPSEESSLVAQSTSIDHRKKQTTASLSFSSNKSAEGNVLGKRKASGSRATSSHPKIAPQSNTKKKAKKESKSLISFGDD